MNDSPAYHELTYLRVYCSLSKNKHTQYMPHFLSDFYFVSLFQIASGKTNVSFWSPSNHIKVLPLYLFLDVVLYRFNFIQITFLKLHMLLSSTMKNVILE